MHVWVQQPASNQVHSDAQSDVPSGNQKNSRANHGGDESTKLYPRGHAARRRSFHAHSEQFPHPLRKRSHNRAVLGWCVVLIVNDWCMKRTVTHVPHLVHARCVPDTWSHVDMWRGTELCFKCLFWHHLWLIACDAPCTPDVSTWVRDFSGSNLINWCIKWVRWCRKNTHR